MTDNKSRRQLKLDQALNLQLYELSPKEAHIRQLHDYPDMKQFGFISEESDALMATATISPHQVTVVLFKKQRAYTFITREKDPLQAMANSADVNPEKWSEFMLKHSNNSAVDECFFWDWKGYENAVSVAFVMWKMGKLKENEILQDAYDHAREAGKAIQEVSPSLPDVISLLNKWKSKQFPLNEQVPLDDYILWDKHYLRALVMLKLLSQLN